MKIIPKYNIGDLLMTKVPINPCDDNTEDNLRSVIGWITDVKTYHQNNLIAYSVQWSDKDATMLLSEEEVRRYVEYIEKARKG